MERIDSGVATKRFRVLKDIMPVPTIKQPDAVEPEAMELVPQRDAVDSAIVTSKDGLPWNAANVIGLGVLSAVNVVTELGPGSMEVVSEKDSVVKKNLNVNEMVPPPNPTAPEKPETTVELIPGSMDFVAQKDEVVAKNLYDFAMKPSLDPTVSMKPETTVSGGQNAEVITPAGQITGPDFITVVQPADTPNAPASKPELAASNTIPMIGQNDDVPAARAYDYGGYGYHEYVR